MSTEEQRLSGGHLQAIQPTRTQWKRKWQQGALGSNKDQPPQVLKVGEEAVGKAPVGDPTGKSLTSTPPSPQYKPPSSEEDEGEDTHKGGITDPTPTPRPQDWSSDDEVPDLVNDKGESDNQVYSTPPETAANTPLNLQQQHTTLSKKLDEALEEALNDNPLPSTSTGRQGGGDREVPPPPGYKAVPRAPLNLAEERWYLEQNKVQYLDAPDTYRANEGRHRVAPLKLLRAKNFPSPGLCRFTSIPRQGGGCSKTQSEKSSHQPPRGCPRASSKNCPSCYT